MGRETVAKRPMTLAARQVSNNQHYATSYAQIASPLAAIFPDLSTPGPSGAFGQNGVSGGGAGDITSSSTNSPPQSYDHFTVPTHLDVGGATHHGQGHGVNPAAMQNNLHAANAVPHTSLPTPHSHSHSSSSGSGSGSNNSNSPPHSTALTHHHGHGHHGHSHALAVGGELPEGTYALEPDEFGSYPGFPSVPEYDEIQESYLRNLSSRKQEKALITQVMYDSIHAVLMDPTNTSYGTPQFRFWVRKMFVLAAFQGEYTVTHEDKPVAAKEQIYQILVHCHGECYHGGRDKTCSQIKQYYSWIPKELVAQFVKACPTCVLKRSNNPKKFVAMLKDIGGASGPDDEYIEYFTSPTRQRGPRPAGAATPRARLVIKAEPENVGVPSSLGDEQQHHNGFGGYQHIQHHHQQQGVYTPGLPDNVAGPSSAPMSINPSSSSAASSAHHHHQQQIFARRASNGSIGGVGSQVHTPLSAVFPSSVGGGDGGWGQASGSGGYGSVGMGRQAGRSLDEMGMGGMLGRTNSAASSSSFAPPYHPSQHHLMAPAMGYSLSEGAVLGGGHHHHHHHSFNNDQTSTSFLPPPSVPQRFHPSLVGGGASSSTANYGFDLPTFAVSSSSGHQQHHQSSVDIAEDGSLIVNHSHHPYNGQQQQQVVVKVEDSNNNQSDANNDANDFLSSLNPSPLVAHRRRPAPSLNLDLSGSNFADYRGAEALLSAVTPSTGGIGNEFGAFGTGGHNSGGQGGQGGGNGGGGGGQGGGSGGSNRQMQRSASMLSIGGGGVSSQPGSAVATTFPSLSLGGGDQASLSALDVLASSAVGGAFEHHHQYMAAFGAGGVGVEQDADVDVMARYVGYEQTPGGPEEEDHGDHGLEGGEEVDADGDADGEAEQDGAAGAGVGDDVGLEEFVF